MSIEEILLKLSDAFPFLRYETRLSNFDFWLPEARGKYNADGGYRCQRIRNEMKLARQHANQMASRREARFAR